MATAYLPPQDDSYQPENSAPREASDEAYSITLLVPDSLSRPLWKSLLLNLRDRIFPVSFPPLRLTSSPVDVITPVGRLLGTPWYRTIFSNLGEVLAPESLPPLQLESRPVDVGELVSDQMSRPWWTSLMRSIGDSLNSESLPPLQLESTPIEVEELISDRMSKSWWRSLVQTLSEAASREDPPALPLTSTPVNPGISSFGLVLPHWSSLLATPKGTSITVPLEAPSPKLDIREIVPSATPAPVQKDVRAFPVKNVLPVPLAAIQVDPDELYPLVYQFKDSLARSRRREIIWVSAISIELIVLLCRYLGLF